MNKVLAGKQAPGFYEAILGKSTNEYMQDMSIVKDNLYRNRLDGMYYLCIKSGSAQSSPSKTYFRMTPVNLSKIFSAQTKLWIHTTEAEAIRNTDIAIDDAILTLHGAELGDGEGGFYFVQSIQSGGFTLEGGKYANHLVTSTKTQASGATGEQLANLDFVNAIS